MAVAKANFKKGNIEEAKRWLKRASNILPDISEYEEQELAEMAIEFGDNEYARQLLERSVTALEEQGNEVSWSLQKLLKAAGDNAGARKAQVKRNFQRSRESRKQKQSEEQNRMFDHVQL